jgi:NADP-dependent 3-hydroxy acid dehydrogenase YdfG
MVSIAAVREANAALKLPANLVAVFVGATSGIGEATLKQFAIHAPRPRVYFIGRSREAGARIAVDLRALNPDGEYIFMPADVSLIRVVDEVCNEIKKKEKHINLLVLSAGVAVMDRRRELHFHIHIHNPSSHS